MAETHPEFDSPSEPSRLLTVWEALRPRQWTKNGLLFAGLLFTTSFLKPDLLGRAFAAFICFCCLSSAVYLLNDLMDRERDLAHPRKRFRPIASGRLSTRAAIQLCLCLTVLALAGSFYLSSYFAALAIAFVALNVAYSLWLKHQVILDVFTLAAGYLLRALAGAIVIQVEISPWLLICTTLIALVLGFGKRRQELASLESAALHRRVLQDYSPAFLDQMITIAVSATVVAYLLYSFQSKTALEHRWIPATIPFVLYGVFRYLYLVHQREMGGAPEDLLFRDRPILIAVAGWCITAAVAMCIP